MKRIRTVAPGIGRERRWPEDLPAGPRDPDVVRASALARARLACGPRLNGEGQTPGNPLCPTR